MDMVSSPLPTQEPPLDPPMNGLVYVSDPVTATPYQWPNDKKKSKYGKII